MLWLVQTNPSQCLWRHHWAEPVLSRALLCKGLYWKGSEGMQSSHIWWEMLQCTWHHTYRTTLRVLRFASKFKTNLRCFRIFTSIGAHWGQPHLSPEAFWRFHLPRRQNFLSCMHRVQTFAKWNKVSLFPKENRNAAFQGFPFPKGKWECSFSAAQDAQQHWELTCTPAHTEKGREEQLQWPRFNLKGHRFWGGKNTLSGVSVLPICSSCSSKATSASINWAARGGC